MLPEKEKMVLNLIDENREEILRYLGKLISFKTVTPSDDEKAEFDDFREHQDLVYETLKEMGFDCLTMVWLPIT